MAQNKPNIALVDDDPKILELTAKYLTDQNLNVFTANGGSALDVIVDANSIDLIVLDPPRSGAAAIMPWVAKSGAKQIIYISCHPSTMVMDAEFLMRAGYKCKDVGVMDMFPHTAHVESIALFEK